MVGGRIIAALVLAMLALGGCANWLDDGAAKLCRALIPAFNPDDARIDVRTTQTTRTVHGVLVTVSYLVKTAADPQRRRGISCILKPEPGRSDRFLLTNLATEDGPLGDARLHLLQRFWIANGKAAISDPQSITPLGPVPDLPRGIAVGLQHALAAIPPISIYALLAAAFALIYGLIGRINLAFGELAMLGGYGAFLGMMVAMTVAGPGLGLALGLALGLVTALVAASAYGFAIGRYVIGPLASRPGQHILIATIGLAIAGTEAVRLLQGTGTRWIGPILSRPLALARADDFVVTMTPMMIVVGLMSAVAVASTLWLMRASRFGRHWRAVADDAEASSLLGIDVRDVLDTTMLIAAMLTGLGGFLMLVYYGGVGSSGGLVIGLKALIAAVIGGIGSLSGALLGAVIVGVAETLWSALFPIEYRDLALFCGLAMLLVLKPDGLFGGRLN